jgi:peptide chain release factor subunit 1
VPPITHETVRELARFEGRQGPVTSLYLDVDGRRHPRRQDYEQQLTRLLRDARDPAATEDLRRIEAEVRSGFDRSATRGLAIFSASADGLWKVVPLPVPVRDQLVVDASPHVRQLETVLDQYGRLGVLLADRQRARVLVFELGVITQRSELFDALPRHEDDRGDFDRDHVHDHVEAAAHRHLKRAAQAAFELWQEAPFDHLLVGAPDDIARELERSLHHYLRDRVAGRLHVPIAAPDDEVRTAVLAEGEAVERRREIALVTRLRDAVGAGNGGVAGLKPTLAAVVERRVDTLLVSDGYVAPGWRCRSCKYVGPIGRGCPICAAEMTSVDDVVEHAIEAALAQSCRVEICRGNADLDVLGRIGALLRF